MPIRLTCKCGQSLTGPDKAAGLQLPCPSCERPLFIPVPGLPDFPIAKPDRPLTEYLQQTGEIVATAEAVSMQLMQIRRPLAAERFLRDGLRQLRNVLAFVGHMSDEIVEEELRKVPESEAMQLGWVAATQTGIGGRDLTRKTRKRYEKWLRDAIRQTKVEPHESVREVLVNAITQLGELKREITDDPKKRGCLF